MARKQIPLKNVRIISLFYYKETGGEGIYKNTEGKVKPFFSPGTFFDENDKLLVWIKIEEEETS